MAWVAGVDGCKAGWVAAFQDVESGELGCDVFRAFAEVLDSTYRPEVVAVDMPIGLAERGRRDCDVEARRLLEGRRSSVFPPPIRPVLHVGDYPEANAKSKELHGQGLSKQAFYLMPKIREVEGQALLHRRRVREAHPELCFWAMNGKEPLTASKKHPAGVQHRQQLLERAYGGALPGLAHQVSELRGFREDDLYDALAALWTAVRILRGEAKRVPHDPPRDSLGLPMEIVY
ncbi:MAG: DUF429 domain-containing protein [Dehalococcoidia bacterium]